MIHRGQKRAQQFKEVTGSAMSSGLWQISKGLLEGPGKLLLPEHTRDALFQLLCDLRTNSPKDRHWAYLHGKALKPRSFPGWMALGSFLSGTLAVLSLASSAILIISLGLASTLACLLSFIGLVVGFWTVMISGCFFGATFLLSGLAIFLASGYLSIETLLKILGVGRSVVRRLTDYQGAIADQSIQMQPSPATNSSSLPAAAFPAISFKEAPASDSEKSSQISTESLGGSLSPRKGKTTFAQLAQEPRGPDKRIITSKRSEDSSATSPSSGAFANGTDLVPPDLSPGRAEAHQHFANLPKSVTGGSIPKPEGGPTVEGKFAEAVHPEAFSRHINGFA